MSKCANPGELRTPIMILQCGDGKDADGYKKNTRKNVFGGDVTVRCKWVNAHGTEVMEAKRLNILEPATLTLRYTPKLTEACEILKMNEPTTGRGKRRAFEVISIDDVEDRHVWLEVKVKRKATAK